MAMTQCEECGNDISDRAQSCPQCGAPGQAAQAAAKPQHRDKVGRTGGVYEALGFVMIVGGMLTTMAAGPGITNNVGIGALVGGIVVFLVGRFK
ncbi:MAG: hypothetical protein CMP08_07710 [Xanthomonadales bacterium]|nr:hypothetical protein [Xanthomonadales bacterium]